MSKKDLQKDILTEGSLTVSDGTLKTDDLLAAIYDLLTKYNVRTSLVYDIQKAFDYKGGSPYMKTMLFFDKVHLVNEDAAMGLLYDNVYEYLNKISPAGYYFGSSDEDDCWIGFFKCGEGEM